MANTTANNSTDHDDCILLRCMFTRGERDLIIASLFAIALISLAGNIPILIVNLFSSKRRNSSNLSTVNLVVSDLLITVLCIPFSTLDLYVFDAWVFGATMCHVVTFARNTAVQASLMNLLTITCEKFLAVRFPFHLRLRKKLVCRSTPVAWIIAMLMSGYFLHFREHRQYDENTFYCIDDVDLETFKKKILVKTITFFCPLTIIIVLYSITVYTLHKGRSTFKIYRNELDSFSSGVSNQTRHKKAVKIIIATLISIIVCWSPFYVLNALFLFDFAYEITMRNLNIANAICAWLLFSHCSVFPFIYCLFTQKGRETIQVCSFCLRTCRMPGDSSNTGPVKVTQKDTPTATKSYPSAQSKLEERRMRPVGHDCAPSQQTEETVVTYPDGTKKTVVSTATVTLKGNDQQGYTKETVTTVHETREGDKFSRDMKKALPQDSSGSKTSKSPNKASRDPTPSPGGGVQHVPSSTSKNAFAKQALDTHNKYRAKHKVAPLKWSDEIAKEAQAWADKLAKARSLQHASKTERKGYGENIAMFSGKFESAGEEATNMWYSEVKDYRFDKPGLQGNTGHFTQVVWKESQELGMGRAQTADGRLTFVVGRYNPAGNLLNHFEENVFKG